MKKSRFLVLFAVCITLGTTTIAFSKKKLQNNKVIPQTNVDTNQLAKTEKFSINYRTGIVTQIGVVNKKDQPDLSYSVVRSNYGAVSFLKTGRAITEQKLRTAKSLDQIIDNYPSTWISKYNSVTISAKINGEIIEAKGKNEKLTTKQKQLLKKATSILIEVQYQKTNEYGEKQNRQMNVPLAVTPAKEAQFIGGYQKMISYLKENSLEEIRNKNLNHLPQPSISFTVNELGKIENVKLEETSRDIEIDQILIAIIKNMPKWKPAANIHGENIKQGFMLNIGQNGC